MSKNFKLTSIPFKNFLTKYVPIINIKDLETASTEIEGDKEYIKYIFIGSIDLEYIINKSENYVWSVVEDISNNRVLLLPGRNQEAKYFVITTKPSFNKNEYVNLKRKITIKDRD